MAPSPRPATLTDANVPPEVLARLSRVRTKLLKARGAISRGRVAPTETEDRLELFAARERLMRYRDQIAVSAGATRDLAALQERIIGRDDILRIGFLARGMLAARSVARLVVLGGAEHGSGFLVAPDTLITNHHVLPDPARAEATEVEFELYDEGGVLVETRRCELDPRRFWFTAPELDVSLVALNGTAEGGTDVEDLGWHPLISQQGKIRIGDAVNIIQHPGGRSKSIVVHNSNLLHLENGSDLSPFFWYSSDTEQGSSGAPVFNNRWEVIGVHHRSVPRTNAADELIDEQGLVIPREEFLRDPSRAVWIANQGVRTSRIVAALQQAQFPVDSQTLFRDLLLERWDASRLRNQGLAAALRAVQPDPGTESQRGTRTLGGRGGVTIRITLD
ncbi:serine protease [Thioalkalicoccus limnaeus]|uniref:Serine protease n=1 Tax=Thioalkalicoccus limnaeus TaxID=120681 RepID=A0ABV4BJF2_9GAMM